MREFREAYGPKRREEEGRLLRRDGVPILVWERTYRLLTPLFGGGVEPREVDPISVVRATEVRGQLRFWWRAIRGWQAGGKLEELWRLESLLFGHAGEGGASPLLVEVEALDPGKEAYPFVDVPGKSFPQARPEVAHPYLAFPLQRTKSDPRNYPVRLGVRFRLRLRFPERVGEVDVARELEAALWAWETFGGIGARTRRGFGALAREGAEPPSEGEILEKLKVFSAGEGWPEGVPHLTPQSLVRVVPLSWKEVAERYRAFRQARPSQNTRHPGRSLWPEPDAVRRRLGRWSPGHEPHHPVEKFPRGQFGLPIIFHFKDKGDPPDTTLKPDLEGTDRLASPLLFRPLAQDRSVVAVLEGPRVPKGGVVLAQGKHVVARVEVTLTPGEAGQVKPLEGQVDPLRAFVMSLKR
ncbi:type III-B CRISPR module RAMP protein Cmr1 [Thermus thalpophilus]